MSNIREQVMARLDQQNIINAMRIAAKDVLADAGKRIFTDGKDSNNASIGDYSTKPIYIAKKNSPRMVGQVKETTLFFPGGYKEFKEKIGRGSQVNARVFGVLMRDYLSSREIIGQNSLKYELKDEFNAKKLGWIEERFKTNIRSLTPEEEKTVQNTFTFEISRLLNQ